MREPGAGVAFESWSAPALEQKLMLLLNGGDHATMSANGTKAFRTRYHREQDAARMRGVIAPLPGRVLYAAAVAETEGHEAVTVIEFGVAERYDLLALQRHARALERETGVNSVRARL